LELGYLVALADIGSVLPDFLVKCFGESERSVVQNCFFTRDADNVLSTRFEEDICRGFAVTGAKNDEIEFDVVFFHEFSQLIGK